MSNRKTIVIENLSALQGGGPTYLLNLLQHIPEGFLSDHRVIVIVPTKLAEAFTKISGVDVLSPPAPQKNMLRRFMWFRMTLPRLLRDAGTDVLYCPGGMLAVSSPDNFQTVVAFRNMLPFVSSEQWRYPLGYQRFRNFLLRQVQSRSFRNADLLIFVSSYAKTLIDEIIPDRRGKSVVIPHGVGEHFRTSAPQSEDEKSEYCLYVSTIDVYKAQLEVVRAWSLVREQRQTSEKLVLVGPGQSGYRRELESLVESLNLSDEVILRDAVPYESLPALYQHAKINIFASACESCPNILLEALASARPVLCSSIQPMPEFGGDAVGYFDPYEPEELAARIVSLIDDEVTMNKMGQDALRQSQGFDWEHSAGLTWQQLSAVAE